MSNTPKGRAPWYRTPVDHTTLKRLVQTNDRIGLVYLGGFVVALGFSGYLGFPEHQYSVVHPSVSYLRRSLGFRDLNCA